MSYRWLAGSLFGSFVLMDGMSLGRGAPTGGTVTVGRCGLWLVHLLVWLSVAVGDGTGGKGAGVTTHISIAVATRGLDVGLVMCGIILYLGSSFGVEVSTDGRKGEVV